MSYFNNTVTLIDNTGSKVEVKTSPKTGKRYAEVSLYTSERYREDPNSDNWQSTEAVIHKVVAFDPRIIATLETFVAGARIKVKGPISYREHNVTFENGEQGTIKSARVVIKEVQPAALGKKHNPEENPFATTGTTYQVNQESPVTA